MYINTFKYTPKDVSCQLCTEYVKKLGCTSVVAKSLISGFRRWRKLRPLPCSSSPRKVCDFVGTPNLLPVAGRAH